MSQEKNQIKCPNCGEEIDVNDILHHQVESQLKKEYEDKSNKQKEEFSKQTINLEKQRQDLDAEKSNQQESIDKKVNDGIKQKESDLKKQIKADVEEEQSDALKSLREDLDEKSSKIKELNKTTVEFEKLKREKDELEESIKAQSEKDLNQKIIEERAKIRKEEADKNELKLKEIEKRLEDQTKLTDEMRRKQEQGSMQTQGEVQELAIEEWLAKKFPLDTIQEIKKGERGADCLQIIHTHAIRIAGQFITKASVQNLSSQAGLKNSKQISEKRMPILAF